MTYSLNHDPSQLREPFQYLICTAHWREHVLAVSPGVLIPRPETEIFPDLAAEALRDNPDLAMYPWADLGTGSGAIAIGTAVELKKLNKARLLSGCHVGFVSPPLVHGGIFMIPAPP